MKMRYNRENVLTCFTPTIRWCVGMIKDSIENKVGQGEDRSQKPRNCNDQRCGVPLIGTCVTNSIVCAEH